MNLKRKEWVTNGGACYVPNHDKRRANTRREIMGRVIWGRLVVVYLGRRYTTEVPRYLVGTSKYLKYSVASRVYKRYLGNHVFPSGRRSMGKL